MSEWREELIRLQSDVSARPLKQDVDAMSQLTEKQMKLLGRKLSRLSSQLEPVLGPGTEAASDVGAAGDEVNAAAIKKQMVVDFSCLSCDKKLSFARKECVVRSSLSHHISDVIIYHRHLLIIIIIIIAIRPTIISNK